MDVMVKKFNELGEIQVANINYEHDTRESLREIILSELYLPWLIVRKYPHLIPSFEPMGELSRVEMARRGYHRLLSQKLRGDHSRALNKEIDKIGKELDSELGKADPAISRENRYLREMCLKEDHRYKTLSRIEKMLARLIEEVKKYQDEEK